MWYMQVESNVAWDMHVAQYTVRQMEEATATHERWRLHRGAFPDP